MVKLIKKKHYTHLIKMMMSNFDKSFSQQNIALYELIFIKLK